VELRVLALHEGHVIVARREALVGHRLPDEGRLEVLPGREVRAPGRVEGCDVRILPFQVLPEGAHVIGTEAGRMGEVVLVTQRVGQRAVVGGGPESLENGVAAGVAIRGVGEGVVVSLRPEAGNAHTFIVDGAADAPGVGHIVEVMQAEVARARLRGVLKRRIEAGVAHHLKLIVTQALALARAPDEVDVALRPPMRSEDRNVGAMNRHLSLAQLGMEITRLGRQPGEREFVLNLGHALCARVTVFLRKMRPVVSATVKTIEQPSGAGALSARVPCTVPPGATISLARPKSAT